MRGGERSREKESHAEPGSRGLRVYSPGRARGSSISPSHA